MNQRKQGLRSENLYRLLDAHALRDMNGKERSWEVYQVDYIAVNMS
jgi:hypothetical protein